MTENYNFEIKRREIYWVSCEGVVSRPGVQQKDRPYLIVSNDLANKNSSVLTGVPLTSNLCKKKLPTHCMITIENICNNPPIRTNIALCEQITSISKKNILQFVGKLTKEEMYRVDNCISIQLGLNSNQKKEI